MRCVILCSWEPHVPTGTPGVYSSVFPGPASREVVWLVVNIDQQQQTVTLLCGLCAVPFVTCSLYPWRLQVHNMTLVAPAGTSFYDCYRGTPLQVIDSLPVANATPVAGGGAA